MFVLLPTFNIDLVIYRYFELLNCINLHFDNFLKNNLFYGYCDLAFEQIQQVYPIWSILVRSTTTVNVPKNICSRWKKYSGNIFSSELFFMEYFFHSHYNYSTCKENLISVDFGIQKQLCNLQWNVWRHCNYAWNVMWFVLRSS